ncbi:MAG: PepSY-like domain-containing protein [Lentisphaeria bacterium]
MQLFSKIIVVAMFAAVSVQAKVISYSSLPLKARTFIERNFGNEKRTITEEDSDGFEQKFLSGVQIEFTKNGDWTEVKGRDLNEKFLLSLPRTMTNNIKDKYPNAKITKVERNGSNYEFTVGGLSPKKVSFTDGVIESGDTKKLDAYPVIKDFVNKYFKGLDVTSIKDKDLIEVIFQNGRVTLEISRSGEWKEIDVKSGSTIPAEALELLPTKAKNYYYLNYRDRNINEMKKRSSGEYEVELGGLVKKTLKFDKDGNLK